MKREDFIQEQAEQSEYQAALAKIASYAIPGTPENRAYHAKLADVQRMALEIRAKKAGR